MSAIDVARSLAQSRLRNDLIYAGHLLLAASMVVWRVAEATPAFSAAHGGTYASSLPGRALAIVTVCGCAAALVAVALRSLLAWREWKSSVLLVLLALAASDRGPIDVFDLVYVGATAVLALVWFRQERLNLAPPTHV